MAVRGDIEDAPTVDQPGEGAFRQQPASGAFDVVDQVLLIPVADIDIGDRLRPVDPEWAAALGAIMARDGQTTPIEVCRLPGRSRWLLVTGGHRLVGAQTAGIAHIRAIRVSPERDDRRAREVGENLWRRGLDPIDRAAFIAELVQLARLRDGVGDKGKAQIAAHARWQKMLREEADNASDIVSHAYGWADDVAARLGLSSKTVYRDLMLHRRLAPAVVERLRGHPVAANAAQLRALAALDPAQQRAVAELLADGVVKTVSAALGTLTQRHYRSDQDKRLSTLLATLGKMGQAERRAALIEVVGRYTADVEAALAKAARG